MHNRRWVLELGGSGGGSGLRAVGPRRAGSERAGRPQERGLGIGIFSARFLAWAWTLHQDHGAQQRELLRQLRRIDEGGR